MSKVVEAFGTVPPNTAPSTLVRYWDQGLLAGAFTFALSYPALLGAAWMVPASHALVRYGLALKGGLATAVHYASAGALFKPEAAAFLLDAGAGEAWRIAAALGVSLGLTGWVMARALTPRCNEWHVAGPQVLTGKEAVLEARRRSMTPEEQAEDPGCLALHPDLVLPKKHWARHMLVYGSVGSGKTQILLPLLKQIIDRDDKLFLFDVKGDFTAKFRRPIIVSPFDRRSYVWDVGRDVRTPTQAAAFAASLIPDEQGNGKFWSQAAQQVLTGAIRALQNTRGENWGWVELARMTSQTAEDMLPMLEEHYLKASALISNPESQSTASVLATVAGYTRVIDDLATAWGEKEGRRAAWLEKHAQGTLTTKEASKLPRFFSITDWTKDSYEGRKQVIVQAGSDPGLTKAYIAAMVNAAVPEIISPALPDNEKGRFIGFVFDELTSIGKIALGPLIDKGRSKGVVVIAGLQDLGQMRLVYGPEETQAMSSMVGTHLVCQIQMGETRDKLSQQLGKRKVAWRTHDDKSTLHEENKALMLPHALTDTLGFRKAKGNPKSKKNLREFGPAGFGIRALVQMGGDVLCLTWPGTVLPDKRPGQVPAKWTTRPAGPTVGYVRKTEAEEPVDADAGPAVRAASAQEAEDVREVIQKAKVAPHALTAEQIDAMFR